MRFLDSKYIKPILLFSFAFTLVWSGWFMRRALDRLSKVTGSSEMVDTQPTSTPGKVYDYLDRCGEEGRDVLVSIYRFEDFIFPFAYGPFFFLGIVWFLRKGFPNRKYLLWLAVVPLLGVCFDYAENFSMIRIIGSFPEKITSASMVGVYTLLKWILLVPSTLLLGISFLLFLRNRNKHSKR